MQEVARPLRVQRRRRLVDLIARVDPRGQQDADVRCTDLILERSYTSVTLRILPNYQTPEIIVKQRNVYIPL